MKISFQILAPIGSLIFSGLLAWPTMAPAQNPTPLQTLNTERKTRSFTGTVQELRSAQVLASRIPHRVAVVKAEQNDRNLIVDLGPMKATEDLALSVGDKLKFQGVYLNVTGRGLFVAQSIENDGQTTELSRRESASSQDDSASRSTVETTTARNTSQLRVDDGIRIDPMWYWAQPSKGDPLCTGVPSYDLISEVAPLIVREQKSPNRPCQLVHEKVGVASLAHLQCENKRLETFYSTELLCNNSVGKD